MVWWKNFKASILGAKSSSVNKKTHQVTWIASQKIFILIIYVSAWL